MPHAAERPSVLPHSEPTARVALSNSDLNALLLAALPELREQITHEIEFNPPLPSVPAGDVYGFTLALWLAGRTMSVQDTPPRTDDRLRRAFDLIERLAEEPQDSPGHFVLHAYVFHRLFGGPEQLALLPRYVPFMRPRTLSAARAASPNEDFDRVLGVGAVEPTAAGRRRAPALLRWLGFGVYVALITALP